jgi:hypothetical protein
LLHVREWQHSGTRSGAYLELPMAVSIPSRIGPAMIFHVTCNKIGTVRVTDLTVQVSYQALDWLALDRNAMLLRFLLRIFWSIIIGTRGVDGKGPGLVRVVEVVAILGFARLASMERVEQGMAPIVTL